MSSITVATLQEWGLALWQQRKPRERKALTLAAAVVVVVVLHAFVLAPLLAARQRLEHSLPTLREQFAQMQVLSKQAALVVDRGAASTPALTKDTIESSLRVKGLKAQSIFIESGIARLQLAGVSFSSLLEWLSETQTSAHLAVVDASIVAQPAADTVNATLTLQQQKSATE